MLHMMRRLGPVLVVVAIVATVGAPTTHAGSFDWLAKLFAGTSAPAVTTPRAAAEELPNSDEHMKRFEECRTQCTTADAGECERKCKEFAFPTTERRDDRPMPSISDQPRAPTGDRPGSAMSDNGEGEDMRDFIDPMQVKEIMRQAKDQQRELKSLLARAKKVKEAAAFVPEIEALIASTRDLAAAVEKANGGDLRDAIEAFHDAEVWEKMTVFRAQIELPKQLSDGEKQITKAERLFKQKAFQRISEFGIDIEKIKADLANQRATIAEVRALLAAGAFEEAQEAMQDTFEQHPGEIQGVLHRLRSMAESLRRIKNADLRDEMKNVLEPIIEAVNEGDYREANMLLGEIEPEMRKIIDQLTRLKDRSKLNTDLQKRMESFQKKIEDKISAENSEPSDAPLP